jgi:hypothetical protein
VFQPILSNSKLIDKSADYRYLHPWLGTGLLTSAGEIIFLNHITYSIALWIIQLTLWGLVNYVNEEFKNTIGNRTRDLPTCSAVPQ